MNRKVSIRVQVVCSNKDYSALFPFAENPLLIENGTFSWGGEVSVLKNINLQVEKGKCVAVVGTVGSGKSSLLSALLGEMDKISGRVNTVGRIAYVPQQAWIQNATLQDNILFGRSMDRKRYDQIIEACALKPDLEVRKLFPVQHFQFT